MPLPRGKAHHMVIAAERMERAIEEILKKHPGITRREIAARVGLHEAVVGKHVKTIRARIWGG